MADHTVQFNQTALRLLAARQELLASNIANAGHAKLQGKGY